MGFVISFGFVFLIIGISTILEKLNVFEIEGSRKFIHIGVSNWWFLAMYFFSNPIEAALMPLCFIVINYISYKKKIFSAMERGEGRKDLGTVYYSISLLILALWTFYIEKPEVGLLGVLIMGYGDGFAALIGGKWGKTSIPFDKEKSLEGSLTVFFFSILITFLILSHSYTNISFTINILISLLMGVLAAIIEGITPNGFDNLSLPIITSVVFFALTNYFI